ncbi:tRNA dihydrouridine synthase [Aureococcus anophagefferens]|nr:tRNA dihydrouridine synthase [Aureococcus anophagefferens]
MAASSARAASPKWWTNIGAPKFVAAPMVDQSGLAFRLLAKTGDGDWPLVAQFAADGRRGPCAACSARPTNNVVALDLNLGCPQQIARKGRYGAFLLEDDVDAAAKVV